MENYIPCEFCNILVHTDNYYEHIMFCNSLNIIINDIYIFNNIIDISNNIFDLSNNYNILDISNHFNFNILDISNNVLDISSNNIIENLLNNIEINIANIIANTNDGIENINDVAPIYDTMPQIHNICAICKEEFSIDSIIRKTLCNHYYCSYCIKKWLKKNKKCPVCMVNLEQFFLSKTT